MQAYALVGNNEGKFVELPEPEIDSPESVIVEMKNVSICETDLKILSGEIRTKKLPIIIGHEGGGVVQQAGGNAGLVQNDRILVDPNIVDYTCEMCKRGLSNLCENGGLMGRYADGLFAQRIRLNAKRVYKIPRNIREEVIPLLQPLSTAVRGASQMSMPFNGKVLVVGVGAMGLLFAKLLKLKGATVLGSRRTWTKNLLSISKEFGVDHPIDASKNDLRGEVRRLTGGKGVDSIVLCADDPRLVSMCAQMVNPGGTVLQFAITHRSASYDMYMLYNKEIKIVGSRSSVSSDFDHAIQVVSSGKLALEKLITATYEFEDVENAFVGYKDRKHNLKVCIRF